MTLRPRRSVIMALYALAGLVPGAVLGGIAGYGAGYAFVMSNEAQQQGDVGLVTMFFSFSWGVVIGGIAGAVAGLTAGRYHIERRNRRLRATWDG